MKFSLVIATTNLHRRKVLTSIIKESFPGIKIEAKEINVKNISTESNKRAKDNAIEKAKFYGILFKNNVLCEDDTLLIEGEEISPNRKGKRILSNSEVFKYWVLFLKENSNVSGKIIKAFALYTQKEIQEDETEIEIHLQLPKKWPRRITTNPLNYFIIPKGYSKPLSDFNNTELKLYRQKETLLLRNLLINTFRVNK